MGKVYTRFQTTTAQKTIPFGVAYTYIPYIRQYPPPPGRERRWNIYRLIVNSSKKINDGSWPRYLPRTHLDQVFYFCLIWASGNHIWSSLAPHSWSNFEEDNENFLASWQENEFRLVFHNTFQNFLWSKSQRVSARFADHFCIIWPDIANG